MAVGSRTPLKRFGGPVNYAEFGPDGELILYGTARVYDGHYLDATNFSIPGAGEATEVIRGAGVAFEFADGAVESIYTQYRIPGTWVDTEDIVVVLLWDTPAVTARCNWEINYQFKGLGDAMDDIVGIGIETSAEASSATSTGLVESQLTIPATDFDLEDKMIRLGVRRDGITDTLGDSAFLHAILMKGIADKLGRTI